MRKAITVLHVSKHPAAGLQPGLQQHQGRATVPSPADLPTLMLKASSNYNYHHHVCRKAEKQKSEGAASTTYLPCI